MIDKCQVDFNDLTEMFKIVIKAAEQLPHPLVDAIVTATILIPVDRMPSKYHEMLHALLASISNEALKLASKKMTLLTTEKGIKEYKEELFLILLEKHCDALYNLGRDVEKEYCEPYSYQKMGIQKTEIQEYK